MIYRIQAGTQKSKKRKEMDAEDGDDEGARMVVGGGVEQQHEQPKLAVNFVDSLLQTTCTNLNSTMTQVNQTSSHILHSENSRALLVELIEQSNRAADSKAAARGLEDKLLQLYLDGFRERQPGMCICSFFKKAVLRYRMNY